MSVYERTKREMNARNDGTWTKDEFSQVSSAMRLYETWHRLMTRTRTRRMCNALTSFRVLPIFRVGLKFKPSRAMLQPSNHSSTIQSIHQSILLPTRCHRSSCSRQPLASERRTSCSSRQVESRSSRPYRHDRCSGMQPIGSKQRTFPGRKNTRRLSFHSSCRQPLAQCTVR